MGKKKSFIDKRASKTYTLVFRSTDDKEEEDADQADRVLVPADAQQGAAAAAIIDREQAPIKDPRALYTHFFGGGDDDEKVSSRRVERLSLVGMLGWSQQQSKPPPVPTARAQPVLRAGTPA